ncbi:hypothetical protein PVAND_012044 [Polypedilum vanderplanki]|uniref:ATP-dependent RNA helicase n=1 Tax=Polypedilum vanderplanki TaxID=319348 RepID=A0A9J6CM76_POLVA|nr:hypothetical protein PVAND_012044 [Polypedilum vanderplanki]
MELILNITGDSDNNVEKKESTYTQNYHAASGFSFEFNDKSQVKAKVVARKRPNKTETITKEDNKSVNSDFKLINNGDEQKDLSETKNVAKKKKKTQEDSVTIDEILKKENKQSEIKQLGVVDFTIVESNRNAKKKKKKNDNKPTIDYAKVPDKKKPEELEKKKQKKQKTKFSKVTNPYPNEPSKNPEISNTSSNIKSPEKKKEKKKQTAVTATEVQSENSSVFTGKSVDSLNIHPFSIKNLKEVLNFHKLTHVQSKSIPLVLENKDVLIRSCTGTGKTLCYALPIVEKLQKITPKISRSQGIHALIIVPTRELCVQTYELFVKLVKPFTWIVPGYLSGGEKRKTEKARLRNGITILVTTPGRLCDHLMHTESMKLENVQSFVLDEADRLLELGYENDVKKVTDTIMEHSKKSHKDIQKILLSATLTAKVKQLAGLTLENPAYVDNENVDTITDSMNQTETDENITIPSGILQKYFIMPPRMRFVVLCSLLVQQMAHGARKILIFFPTQHVVDYHYDILVEFLTQSFTKKEKTMKSYLNNDEEDIDAMLEEQEESDDEADEGNIWLPNVTLFKLFGSMTQIERISVFREFKAAKSGILLCTDVAARGLDVPQLDLVIQYSAPQEFVHYVHRCGRTARIGNKGCAIIFLTRNEDKFIDYLKKKKIEITEDDYTRCIREIQLPNMQNKIFEEKILILQRKLEDLLNNDEELRMKASRAFTSWICYYKTFSKELRHMFNLREIHLGHLANNFGLRDAPKAIVKQYSKGEETKKERNKNFDFKHRVHVPRGDQNSFQRLKRKHSDFSKTNFGKVSKISEFDSGLPELKKPRKK